MTGVSLKELARLSKDLNEASDALSEKIAQVEIALNELKLGVRAWVLIRSEQNYESGGAYPMTESVYLGYGKHRGKWGLLYLESIEEFPDRDTTIPLRDAARDERVEAVDKLPDLVCTLEKKTKELTEQANSKAAQVAELAEQLRK